MCLNIRVVSFVSVLAIHVLFVYVSGSVMHIFLYFQTYLTDSAKGLASFAKHDKHLKKVSGLNTVFAIVHYILN